MSGAVLFCSVQIHRIVPGQVTLTRTNVLRVHQSTINADKDWSAKNINLGPGSYGHMVVCTRHFNQTMPVLISADSLCVTDSLTLLEEKPL